MTFLIKGRGLSGALMVDALLTHGVSPDAIWAQGHLTSPAGSLAPAALLNPLTGRSLKPPVEGSGVFKAAQATWTRLQSQFSETILSRTVYRPFFDEHKLFEKLKKTYEAHQETLRAGWGVRDADSDEVRALKQATTTRCNGAMAIDGSFALELPDFLSAYWQWAMTQGLHFDTEAPKDATTIRCDGAAIREILPPSIPLEPLGGELFAVQPIKELPETAALAGDGHYIRLDATRAVVGSTYRREGQAIDVAPWDHLHRRLGSWLPKLEGPPLTRWYGERLIVPDDRKPIVGPIHGDRRRVICTGFASKGLYWAPYATQALARALLQQEAIPDVISLRRFGS